MQRENTTLRHDAAPVLDQLGRPLHDLRVSVTDRCNFRCDYCMPKAIYADERRFLPTQELLSFGEITRVVSIAARELGVRKLRLTGGEPLLRPNLTSLIERLAATRLLSEITLTTNGLLLADQVSQLKAAGLDRITVSLDSVDADEFVLMSGGVAGLDRVLAGIAAASGAGFASVKINCVVVRGRNEHAVVALAERFRGTPHILRFIEYMDVGHSNGWRMDDVVPSADIVEAIGRELLLEPVDANYAGEVAERWRYADGSGEIGVISSVTQSFCSDCSRARLSTDGKLYTCLFATQGRDFRALLRGGASDEDIGRHVAALWRQRDDRYSDLRSENTPHLPKVEMSYIGG
jgi:cyclic pyranopterin phosphate synthase